MHPRYKRDRSKTTRKFVIFSIFLILLALMFYKFPMQQESVKGQITNIKPEVLN